MRQEEAATRAPFVKEEKVLLFANDAMVSFLRLFAKLQVIVHELLVGKRNAVDSLQSFVLRLPVPVGARILRYRPSVP